MQDDDDSNNLFRHRIYNRYVIARYKRLISTITSSHGYRERRNLYYAAFTELQKHTPSSPTSFLCYTTMLIRWWRAVVRPVGRGRTWWSGRRWWTVRPRGWWSWWPWWWRRCKRIRWWWVVPRRRRRPWWPWWSRWPRWRWWCKRIVWWWWPPWWPWWGRRIRIVWWRRMPVVCHVLETSGRKCYRS